MRAVTEKEEILSWGSAMSVQAERTALCRCPLKDIPGAVSDWYASERKRIEAAWKEEFGHVNGMQEAFGVNEGHYAWARFSAFVVVDLLPLDLKEPPALKQRMVLTD